MKILYSFTFSVQVTLVLMISFLFQTWEVPRKSVSHATDFKVIYLFVYWYFIQEETIEVDGPEELQKLHPAITVASE